jgi:hypothetical protein
MSLFNTIEITNMNDNNNIILIVTYNNMDINKGSIIWDNKKKNAVYIV